MKKVGFVTTFYETASGYSLATVCETQIRMLLDHGYEPIVLVQDQYSENGDGKVEIKPFKEMPPPSIWNNVSVDLRPVIPPLKLHSGITPDFEDRVILIQQALEDNLDDVDVVITHDIMAQEWFKEHNVAVRNYALRHKNILWLHWLHSCPSPARAETYPHNCRYTPPPGYIVYPNASDKSVVCQAYNLSGSEHRVKSCRAGHAIDPINLWPYDKLTKDLAKSSDLLAGDIIAVYPARLDRGKQPEKIIRIMAGVKKAGYEPRLLIIDWQSAGARFQEYIDQLLDLARELGIKDCVNFTSRLDDRCNQGVPRQVVLELMDLSNVYIHPSRTETYSLVVHEAILRNNLVCLNYDFPAMRELFGEGALYFDFGSDRTKREYHPDEQSFWNDEALRLISELRHNRVLAAKMEARKRWTPGALWKEFEALLYLEPI